MGFTAANRAERKDRAYAAVAASLDRDNDAWACYQRAQREKALRKQLPTRIEKARARLVELETKARDLGIVA